MSVEPGVIDANILVYAVDADAPQHAVSRALLDAARDPTTRLYVSSQVLCEFYSIITNPRRVRAARSPTEALDALIAVLSLPGIHVLPMPARAVPALVELLRERPVIGGDVFDLQLVATMYANNIQRIYTFNEQDFTIFSELAVFVPK